MGTRDPFETLDIERRSQMSCQPNDPIGDMGTLGPLQKTAGWGGERAGFMGNEALLKRRTNPINIRGTATLQVCLSQ